MPVLLGHGNCQQNYSPDRWVHIACRRALPTIGVNVACPNVPRKKKNPVNMFFCYKMCVNSGCMIPTSCSRVPTNIKFGIVSVVYSRGQPEFEHPHLRHIKCVHNFLCRGHLTRHDGHAQKTSTCGLDRGLPSGRHMTVLFVAMTRRTLRSFQIDTPTSAFVFYSTTV